MELLSLEQLEVKIAALREEKPRPYENVPDGIALIQRSERGAWKAIWHKSADGQGPVWYANWKPAQLDAAYAFELLRTMIVSRGIQPSLTAVSGHYMNLATSDDSDTDSHDEMLRRAIGEAFMAWLKR